MNHRQSACAPVGDAAAVPPRTAPLYWQEGEASHIDVRGLAPPQPLVAILRLVHGIAGDGPVIVHHDRDPVLLYPELAQIGWGAERLDGDPGELRLILRRLP